ncbi:DUF4959 domain-containing protein [Niabella pedocola]|uniref:DUF4959 domain-containing protein n=1 Tax=Niabella pedocola TaxID=1752077 RepID=A0ABS8PJE7_9BACT|nr:DUF4959 domain-containing protein [Niabella pedocola]MCD2421126.1 DUF4959 domain-containing protein [Niabella pedocola]
MKYFLYTKTILLIILLSCYGCKQDTGITINKVGAKPDVVSNIQVTPLSGGAIIKYDLPASEDLRYVKATYHLDNGTVRETKGSIYNNHLTVEGFGKEGTYDVELRSVSVGEVASDPVIAKVTVLRPPYLVVLDSLRDLTNVVTAFGGLNINYHNQTKADLVIRVIKIDSTGKWAPVQSEYTSRDSGIIRVRSQQAQEITFGIYVEDRYDHFSDTLQFKRTPIEEVKIPTTLWKKFALPNDVTERVGSFPFSGIWDNNTNNGFLSTTPNITLPNSLTIDMGIQARLSRMQIWATRYSTLSDVYGPAHIYDFEVYGSNNPTPTGEWDNSWTSLGRFVGSRPLTGFGFGVPATTAEQNNIRDNGETYEFPDPTNFGKFRYIRIRTYATWNGSYEGDTNVFVFELRLFGQL